MQDLLHTGSRVLEAKTRSRQGQDCGRLIEGRVALLLCLLLWYGYRQVQSKRFQILVKEITSNNEFELGNCSSWYARWRIPDDLLPKYTQPKIKKCVVRTANA